MITAIIVDDEKHNVVMLQSLLKENCPDIKVLDFANSADSGFEKINMLKPQLVFLDIKMPQKSGFDLLRMFPEINFEVIFVSAFNEYAITAFEFNALGYILKPIDYVALQKTVKNASSIIYARRTLQNNDISQFLKTLEDKGDKINKISVHHNDKVIFLNVKELAFIEYKTDFCELNMINRSRYTSSKELKKFENLLSEIGSFIRINKGVIINTDYIKSYTKGDICTITITTGQSFEVSRRKKTEVILLLKNKTLA
ncbi:MAG: response regulator [Bacteroidetes bacterium]|nr:response regulator [Bacteroidota bacterium]